MFNGLRNAIRHYAGTTVNGPQRSANSSSLDTVLQEDARTRKQQLSKFSWFQEKIKARQAAETKLRQSSGQSRHGCCVFLIRSSSACAGEFVLSFLFEEKCLHYNITYTNDYKYCFENGPRFAGVELMIEHYLREKTTRELPCRLERPCGDGEPPPSLSMSVGYTNLLHKAISAGNAKKAGEILMNSHCPQLDDRDEQGNTALHLASAAGMAKVVGTLIEKGATVSAADRAGYTPLQRACEHNQAVVARMLIVQGDASPHRRVPDTGNVPLHLAAEHGHFETVQVLLSLDVPSCARNYSKQTPYELAQNHSFEQCADAVDNYSPPAALTNRHDWFHETASREEAEGLLDRFGAVDGLFLIRPSARSADCLSLDVCYRQQKIHYIVTHFMTTYFINDGPLLPSLEHLVEYYCVVADGMVTTLQYAVCPNGKVKSMESISDGCRTRYPPDLPGRSRPPAAKEPMILDRKSISTTIELGQGEFGSVLKGTWAAPTGELVPVAVKTLNPNNLNTGKDEFLGEAKVMVQLDHPCIVKLIGICQEPELMLVQELLAMGSLLDFLLDYAEKVSVNIDLLLWASQVAYGMSYLETKALVHRDLAARNILLASKAQVKICDFGLSRATGAHSNYYRAAHGGRWPVKWYAPESINYGTFSSASDVWGYGVTLWEMYSLGDQPYDEMTGSEVLQFIERNGRLDRPKLCPAKMFSLMCRCWSYAPAQRPTFSKIYRELQVNINYVNVPVKKT